MITLMISSVHMAHSHMYKRSVKFNAHGTLTLFYRTNITLTFLKHGFIPKMNWI